LRSCRYLKKCELGISYFNLSCSNDAKLLSTYRSFKVANPFLVQISKDPSITEGLNILFLDIGALISMLLSENARLNCAQTFKECLTTGFIEYLDIGSGNGSLEQSKASKEAGPHDNFSNCNHFGPLSCGGLSQCNIARMLADQ